jgi:two-component system chemotaxis response regulator CheB
MPANAVKNDSPRYILPVEEIAAKLIELVGEPAEHRVNQKLVPQLTNETKLAELDMSAINADKPGAPSAYVCPECNGTLFEIREGELVHFRCRVGHAYGAESLLVSKSEELEGALWTAMRTLEEKAALYGRMGDRAKKRHNSEVSDRFQRNAEDMRQQAQIIRDMLLERQDLPLTGTEN